MSDRPALDFWFDFASTYSYIGAMRIEGLCRDAGVALTWRPFLLGPIFSMQGWSTSHFNLNERRGAYMWRDMERLTAKFGLPWMKPTVFPRITTVPARIAISIAAEPWAGDFVRRVFVAGFGEDRDISDEVTVRALLDELGQPADEIVAAATSPAQRGALRAQTERAAELNIFGAPNCIVGAEHFWGEETLEDAIAWAKRGGP